MKNIFLFVLFSIPFFNYSQSEKALDFKMGYSPQTSYIQVIEQSLGNELLYSGSEDFLKKLKENGVENPTITTNTTITESILRTGKLQKDGNFPLTIEFTKSTSSDQKVIIPNGTFIYGKASVSSMPKLDSIVSKDLDATFKTNLLQTIQSTFSQMALPEKKMKIGESFSQETPLKIPVATLTFDMLITTTYKLIGIQNQTANFDIVQDYTLKIADNDQQFDINASGNGKGKLDYNIPNHFSTQFNLDIELNMGLKRDEFGLNAKSKSSFKQTVQISKN
jgi:hypothetical protein